MKLTKLNSQLEIFTALTQNLSVIFMSGNDIQTRIKFKGETLYANVGMTNTQKLDLNQLGSLVEFCDVYSESVY